MKCSICTSPHLVAIGDLLDGGATQKDIAAQFKISKYAISRHLRHANPAPVTPETERAGIAGSLFVVAIGKGAWPVNEVLKISGPFARFLREATPRAR